MLETLALLGGGWAAAAATMALAWVDARARRNAAIVDVAWTTIVGVLSAIFVLFGPGDARRRWVFLVMVVAWAGRLSWHLVSRAAGAAEDPRYAALRREWGADADRQFFRLFQQQAVAAVLFAAPALIISRNTAPSLSPLEIVASGLWAIAFLGEAVADWQLARWKEDPEKQGLTCRTGLWAWSRHPNYFFEWLMWVAWALFAAASPWGYLAALCPVAMLYFLLRVTGIPLAEAQALRTRGDDYRRYREATSAFVPWPPAPAAEATASTRLPGSQS